jgi:hypothetical protein
MQVPQERVFVDSKPLDGVTRYGLHMLSKAMKDWVEISVLGYIVLYSSSLIIHNHYLKLICLQKLVPFKSFQALSQTS